MMNALKDIGQKQKKMEIINLTPEVAELQDMTFQLGAMKKGTKKEFKVLIKNQTHKTTGVSCGGCTQAIPRQVGGDIEIAITYTANGSKVPFEKSVTETTAEGNKFQFKLKGSIV